jgi:Questin oxidase-like
MLPEPLTTLLRRHRDAFAPVYPPHENSDHAPMACLAMYGLGFEFPQIERFAAGYRSRLAPLAHSPFVVNTDNWRDCASSYAHYAALLEFFDAQIVARGWQAVLAEYLPMLISGWVKDAFHPLIRLGYGVEFEVPSEIAAGLAYWACLGDDPALAALVRQPARSVRGDDYFRELQRQRLARFSRGPFNDRYAAIIAAADLAPVAGPIEHVMPALGRACLAIFDSTHDFFALHLVTAGHAFRVCAPWAGDAAAGLFSTGLAIAYLAIGAPHFAPPACAPVSLPRDALARATDEHDLKLAYSCRAQAAAWQNPAFEWCATAYLQPRLHSA